MVSRTSCLERSASTVSPRRSTAVQAASENGKVTRGKDALAVVLKKGLEENKGSKISSKINSLRLLRPDVAMEDGTLEFAAPDGLTRPTPHHPVDLTCQIFGR